jgi:DNA-damage-inducible protein D
MSVDDKDLLRFESGAHENGVAWWSARWLMELLGYATWAAFKTVLTRALSSCMSLGLDASENFLPYRREHDGRTEEDFRLSRFACFLIANHADGHKPQVEQVKAYLASIAAAAVELDPDVLERLREREVVSVGERAMSSAASQVGVRSYELGIFKDSGYRGMYNMSLRQLKEHKGLDLQRSKGTLYDYMGIAELAANSFRVTQTAERLKRFPVDGLKQAETVAKGVGAEVRAMMMSEGGTAPEDLALEEHIGEGKKVLKAASRQLAELDKPRN